MTLSIALNNEKRETRQVFGGFWQNIPRSKLNYLTVSKHSGRVDVIASFYRLNREIKSSEIFGLFLNFTHSFFSYYHRKTGNSALARIRTNPHSRNGIRYRYIIFLLIYDSPCLLCSLFISYITRSTSYFTNSIDKPPATLVCILHHSLPHALIKRDMSGKLIFDVIHHNDIATVYIPIMCEVIQKDMKYLWVVQATELP